MQFGNGCGSKERNYSSQPSQRSHKRGTPKHPQRTHTRRNPFFVWWPRLEYTYTIYIARASSTQEAAATPHHHVLLACLLCCHSISDSRGSTHLIEGIPNYFSSIQLVPAPALRVVWREYSVTACHCDCCVMPLANCRDS